MDVDKEIQSYPIGSIFEVHFDPSRGRSGEYIFKKESDFRYKVIELYDRDKGEWRTTTGVPWWQDILSEPSVFTRNGVIDVIYHGTENGE